MKFQVKKDPWVIVPYTIFTLVVFGLFAWDKLSMAQLLAMLSALNLPTAFGLIVPPKDPPTEPEIPNLGNGEDDAPPPNQAHRLLIFAVPTLLCLYFLFHASIAHALARQP